MEQSPTARPAAERFFQVEWRDLDANAHMMNTAYSGLASELRGDLHQFAGIPASQRLQPRIDLEEIRYLKELQGGDSLRISLSLIELSPDTGTALCAQELLHASGRAAAELRFRWRFSLLPEDQRARLTAALEALPRSQLEFNPDPPPPVELRPGEEARRAEFRRAFELRWADVDAAWQSRSTALSQACAHWRFVALSQAGFGAKAFQDLGMGPIILREELHRLDALGLDDRADLNFLCAGLSPQGSRWRVRHEIRANEKTAAILTIDGAWLNLSSRRTTNPPKELLGLLESLPRTIDFQQLRGR